MENLELIYIVIVILVWLVFALGGFFIGRSKVSVVEKDKGFLEDKLSEISEHQKHTKQALDEEKKRSLELLTKVTAIEKDKEHLQSEIATLYKNKTKEREQLLLEFENLAGKILKQNSEQFSVLNKSQMDQILSPLKEKITGFEKRINDVYTEETKQRSEIKQQIFQLIEVNQLMSTEAKNLTKALKGDTKLQGNWGELILEKVLENSGLTKGQEYEVQHSDTNEEGKRIQPDIIVHLPDNKHLIVDSKVSLTAYESYVNQEDKTERKKYLSQHLLSVKNHIKQLSEKKYQTAQKINPPDFILLFMPLEPAFSLALKEDTTLYAFAWKFNIVLVSPTTLLATLKTISSIWRQEKQTKNAIEIAQKAGSLYDKFVGFIHDMEGINKSLNNAQKAYIEAKSKLSEGKGNLVSRVENLKKLGAKAKESKALPESYINKE